MPFADYYCHSCQRSVSLQDGDFKCAQCGGEFIEEIPLESRASMPPLSSVNPTDVGLILSAVLNPVQVRPPFTGRVGGIPFGSNPNAEGASASGPAQGFIFSAPASGRGHGDETMIPDFLNQLLSNLTAQGAQVQIQFSSDPNIHTTVLSGSPLDYAWGDLGLDQIVTQLLNQFEGGATPIDESLLPNIPITAVDQKQVDSEAQCTTCMEIFKLNEQVAQLNCQHIFHRDCILPWLRRHNTCPICRQVIDATKWPVCDPLDELD
ncbi:hypothetical protein AB6A40_002842 [Gnathostoma spinigerum]|uniref:RING-type E3 ubiquitin transferase n=1 Tax=Gnathostoma spinigerum TaxID=75299 RepID=A0ABD6E7S1_9BILA